MWFRSRSKGYQVRMHQFVFGIPVLEWLRKCGCLRRQCSIFGLFRSRHDVMISDMNVIWWKVQGRLIQHGQGSKSGVQAPSRWFLRRLGAAPHSEHSRQSPRRCCLFRISKDSFGVPLLRGLYLSPRATLPEESLALQTRNHSRELARGLRALRRTFRLVQLKQALRTPLATSIVTLRRIISTGEPSRSAFLVSSESDPLRLPSAVSRLFLNLLQMKRSFLSTLLAVFATI